MLDIVSSRQRRNPASTAMEADTQREHEKEQLWNAARYAAPAGHRVVLQSQDELGDIGTSYGDGRLDLAATRKRSPLIPAGTGAETGEREQVGGLEVLGEGTFNRPAHREVVGAGGGPVHVLRGTRSTYAGGAPGEEWTSLQRAAQAVNRATGQGEYVPPGASLEGLKHRYKMEEIKATGKAMEAQGGLAAQAQKGATDYLTQMLLQQHGIADPTDKTGQTKILPDYVRGAMLKVLPQVKTMEDVPKILEQLKPGLEQGKQVDLFNNPATRESSRAKVLNMYRQDMAAAGRSPDPNLETVILKGAVTPANLEFFNQAHNRAPAKQGAVTSTGGTEQTSIRQLRKAAEEQEYYLGNLAPGHDFSTETSGSLYAAWKAKQAEKEKREQALDRAFVLKRAGIM